MKVKRVNTEMCHGVLESWGFWFVVVISGAIVLSGILATWCSMQLKTKLQDYWLDPRNGFSRTQRDNNVVPKRLRVRILPSIRLSLGGRNDVDDVVSTSRVIQRGNQEYLGERVGADGEAALDIIPRAVVVVVSPR